MKIKIDKADKAFSQYIRLRDKKCVRCYSSVKFNNKGLPISHQCSHYFGRGKESTRFDEKNCDCLCYGCHQYWGSTNREQYREYMIRKLGRKGFDLLCLRTEIYKKKDRKLDYIIAKELLKDVRSRN